MQQVAISLLQEAQKANAPMMEFITQGADADLSVLLKEALKATNEASRWAARQAELLESIQKANKPPT